MMDQHAHRVLRTLLVLSVLLPCGGCSDRTQREDLPDATTSGPPTDSAPKLRVDLGSATEATELEIPLATPAPAAAAGTACFWPRFHGPDGRNVSGDIGLLKEWPENGPPLAWKTSGIGMGFSSVTIGDGQIYVDGNLDGKTVVTAMDMEGNVRWQADNGAAWTEDHEGTRGTPTIDGDRVYHESPLGEVVCLNAKTGQKLWDVNILKEFGGTNLKWALAESLLVDGQRLICCPGGTKASVAALDKMTGKTVWTAKSTGDQAGYASPILVEYQGVRMILTMSAKAFLGIHAERGDLLWRHEHITDYDVNATMPLYHEGYVFISSGYRSGSELLKIKVDGANVGVERVWESKELDNHHGGVVLVDGYVYGAAHSANNGKWICLEWKTGKKMYAERGVGKGSATFADGMLYAMSERGAVGLVPATPSGHEIVSHFKLPDGGEGPTWAHPVVCGGRLYLRHGDWLYAYDVRAK